MGKVVETLDRADLKNKILADLRSTNRVGIENLIQHMNDVKYFDMPASSGNHMAKDGGLAEHSYNVAQLADKLALNWLPFGEYLVLSPSILIVSYLHDIGKCGAFGVDGYVENILKSGKRSDAKPYEVNKELPKVPHEIYALTHIVPFVDLTPEEYFAICFHNGLYVGLGRDLNGNERPLQMILHFADMWASRVEEAL